MNMYIRIIKALGDSRPVGPSRHFTLSLILKKLKKPNVITGEMFWKFLSLYFNMPEGIEVPKRLEYEPYTQSDADTEDPDASINT